VKRGIELKLLKMVGVGGSEGRDPSHSNEHLKVLASDLDLFTDRLVNASHNSTKFIKVPTLSNLQNRELNSIEFEVSPNDSYVDLKRTQIELRVKILKKDAISGSLSAIDPTEDGIIGPSNLLLHTLIERIEFLVGPARENISGTDNSYGLRTYIETLLNYGSDSKKSHLSMGLYLPDTPKFHDSFGADNIGFTKRNLLFANGAEVSLRGYLNLPLFRQNKLLLSQTGFRLKIFLKPALFCLMGEIKAGKTHTAAIQFTQATLHLCNVRVNPNIMLGHEAALAKNYNAKYQIMHPMVTHHTINKDSRNFSYPNLFAGEIPSLVYVVFQNSESFEGALSKNCLKLEHCSISTLKMSVDGEAYPTPAFETDFTGNSYLDAYNSIFTGTSTYDKDIGHEIDRLSYKQGMTIFCFDLAKNGHGSCSEIRDTAGTGDVSIDVHFAVKLANTTVMSVIGYIKTSLELTMQRQVIKFYR